MGVPAIITKKGINIDRNKIMKRPLALFFMAIVLLWPSFILANDDRKRSLGISFHAGYILPHSDEIKALANKPACGIALQYQIWHGGKEDYELFDCFWNAGFEYRYFNFLNPKILGSAHDFTLYLEPILYQHSNFIFTSRLGTGINYLTRIYDPIDNPTNKFFGSPISFPLFIEGSMYYKVSEASLIKISLAYNHISNGGIKQPNKGMNWPSIVLGYTFAKHGIPSFQREERDNLLLKKNNYRFSMYYFNSLKVIDSPKKLCYIYGVGLRYYYSLSYKYQLHATTEVYIDSYIKENLLRWGDTRDYKRAGAGFGHAINFGRLSLTQTMAYYYYAPYPAMTSFYHRHDLLFNLYKGISAGVFLKAHKHVADLMGIQMVYGW